MLKLYLSYLIVGIFLFLMTLFIWGLSGGVIGLWPYISLFSSLILFTTASVFALYKPKVAAIIGLVTTLGLLQFVWFVVKEIFRGSLNAFGAAIVCLLVWYFATIITSAIIVLKRQSVGIVKVNKLLLWILSVVPPALFVFWLIATIIPFR